MAPVVEKPEQLSNTASAKFGISPEITKGRAPIRGNSIHIRDTIKKPSRILIGPAEGFMDILNIKPAINTATAIFKNVNALLYSLYINDTITGSANVAEITIRILPIIFEIAL